MTGQAGYSWAELIANLVAAHGSLAAVAAHLAESRAFAEDVQSAERGLRRLRLRQGDGGVWGARVLRCFGLPTAITGRLRWMGQYHRRFTDLPASLCIELLRPWDRPPVNQSPARIWLVLAHLNLVLRRRDDPTALLTVGRQLAHRAPPVAQAEWGLLQAFVDSRCDRHSADAMLKATGHIIDQVAEPHDRACLFARWIDQIAYPLKRQTHQPPDHEAALALYAQIPSDGPPFARCRRANGLGWTTLKLGDRIGARLHAQASVEAAGDAGSLRMRAMALNLLAKTSDGVAAESARARAAQIADHLEDEALASRIRPATRVRPPS
jgi:hypothetical protein